MSKTKKILIATGGTGGHLFPAQKMAELLDEKNVEVVFAGKGLKKNLFFQRKKFSFFEIQSSSIRSKNPFKLFHSSCFLMLGFFQSLFLLLKQRPDVIIGFGSFHTFPILLACKCLNMAIVLYEPNRICGKVNRFFSKRAKKMISPFHEIEQNKAKHLIQIPFFPWISPPKVSQQEARKMLKLEKDLFTFFIFGGSQGAIFLNEQFLEVAEKLKSVMDFQVIHLVGKKDRVFPLRKRYLDLNIPNVVKDFENNMSLNYFASNIVICRSGAMTINELISFEKPAILVPYPFATEDHQNINANFLKNVVKGAEKILEKNCKKETLFKAILHMTEKKSLKTYRANIQAFKKTNKASIKSFSTSLFSDT